MATNLNNPESWKTPEEVATHLQVKHPGTIYVQSLSEVKRAAQDSVIEMWRSAKAGA